jgi:prepilin-type N-terminal cleavage/methylation domain-containing protein
MNRIKAFTLIELLTVIAIIAILAAIAFPVYSRVKDSAYRGSDSTNMGALATALNLYKVDQGGYPPQLLGYVTLYDPSKPPGENNVVPAGTAINFLYPRRVSSLETFRPTLDRPNQGSGPGPFDANTVYTTAFWPNKDSRAAQTAPYLDLNGDGVVDNTVVNGYYDDDARARQAFSISDQVTRTLTYSDYTYAVSQGQTPLVGGETAPASGSKITLPAYYYNVDGYDVATVPDGSGGTRTEIHYSLFWTRWGTGWEAAQSPGPPPPSGNLIYDGGGNGHDDPRQLGYADPPDSTVVTWNSFFRNYDDNGIPTRDKRDIVLFLGGGALSKDSRDVSDRSWRITP